MDVVNEIEVLESDVKYCNEKCQRVNAAGTGIATCSSPWENPGKKKFF